MLHATDVGREADRLPVANTSLSNPRSTGPRQHAGAGVEVGSGPPLRALPASSAVRTSSTSSKPPVGADARRWNEAA